MLVLWLIVAVAHTAFMVASIYYWNKVISPAVDVVKSAEQITPLLQELREQLLQAPALLAIVERINENVDHAAEAAKLVAQDLEEAHARADAVTSKVPGEAADAAAVRGLGNP